MRRRAGRAVLVSLGLVLLHGRKAHAEEPNIDTPPKCRCGLMLGLASGVGFGAGSGYPNNATQIDKPEFYSASGLLGGASHTLLVGGAISDYVNVLGFYNSSSFQSASWKSSGGGVGLRLEGYPLLSLSRALSALSVFGQFGIGFSELRYKKDALPKAEGSESLVGVGASYEFRIAKLFSGHMAVGPTVEYNLTFTRSFQRDTGVFGLRLVAYGGK